MDFIDELPAATRALSGYAQRQERMAEELRANAGRWALIKVSARNGDVYQMRKRWTAKFPDLEFEIRRVDGEYRLYARAAVSA